MTDELKLTCPKCGHEFEPDDEELDKALQYQHDLGFDEGYEAASEEADR